MVIKKINSSSLSWLVSKTRQFVWRIFFLTLCAVLVSYVSVRFALLSKDLLDSALIESKRPFFKTNLIYLALLVVVQLILHIAYTLVALKTEGVLRNKLQSSLFNSLLYKKWQSVTSFHSGEILNRLNGDINIVSAQIVSTVPSVFSLVAKIILAFTALYTLDRDFAFIFVVLGPVVMLVARLYSRKIKPLSKKCLESQGRVHSFILDSIRNLLVIKSFGVAESITEKAKSLQTENLSLIMKRGFISIFANILFYISLTAGYYFAVGWCAWKIANSLMSIGVFTAILQLVGQVQTPFKELASVIPHFYTMTASAERIIELETLPEEKLLYKDINISDLYNNMESININSLSFSYNEEKIFDCVSAEIKKGSLVAVSGISGIGKSTLLKLIMGILSPESGNISINTPSLSYDSDASLRGLFAYVPQGNMILAGTVRENIAFMNDKADDKKIISAAKTACIWDVINELPNGLDTRLGEGGMGLSEGQIQRLAVARAICSGAPILLLDEATSALDEKTEQKMLENIMADKNRTCIIISHRDCALSKCDVSLVIDNKKIVTRNQHD